MAGGGYGAVLLLDTWALLTRADLRAGEETLRRWLAAAALAVPGDRGGRVVVVADGALAPVQALIRFDPGWLAARDLAERRELGFPPAVRMASLTGTPAAVAELPGRGRLPARRGRAAGPVPIGEDQERYLVRDRAGRRPRAGRCAARRQSVYAVRASGRSRSGSRSIRSNCSDDGSRPAAVRITASTGDYQRVPFRIDRPDRTESRVVRQLTQ